MNLLQRAFDEAKLRERFESALGRRCGTYSVTFASRVCQVAWQQLIDSQDMDRHAIDEAFRCAYLRCVERRFDAGIIGMDEV